jgi:hypothetical protein
MEVILAMWLKSYLKQFFPRTRMGKNSAVQTIDFELLEFAWFAW